mgnify:CR=1 FL=1
MICLNAVKIVVRRKIAMTSPANVRNQPGRTAGGSASSSSRQTDGNWPSTGSGAYTWLKRKGSNGVLTIGL